MRGMWGEREDEGKEDIAQDVYLEAFPPNQNILSFCSPSMYCVPSPTPTYTHEELLENCLSRDALRKRKERDPRLQKTTQ